MEQTGQGRLLDGREVQVETDDGGRGELMYSLAQDLVY
jgi:hypothetical protein